MTEQYLDKPKLRELVSLSAVTIWRLEKEGKFPRRRQISTRRVAWLLSEVLEWQKAQQIA